MDVVHTIRSEILSRLKQNEMAQQGPRRRLLIVALAIVIVGAVGAWAYRYVKAYEEQINNLELAKSYVQALEEYRGTHHAYPDRLSEVFGLWRGYASAAPGADWWGHPLYYESNGRQFLLISLGRDGRPDRPMQGYGSFRSLERCRRICGRPNDDQVLSERGFHQACYK